MLRRAAVVPDALGSGGHVFLIPEDGRDALAGLHERLYEDVVQPQCEAEHVVYAARDRGGGNGDRSASHPRGELNAKSLSIRGSISEIVLVDVTNGGNPARRPFSARAPLCVSSAGIMLYR